MYPEWLQWYVLWFAALQFQHESQWLELYLRAGCGTEGFLFYPDQRILRKKREYGHVFSHQSDARAVTDPSGQSVNYSYDASNRVTGVQSTYAVNGEERVSRNEYTYENDRLKTVAHNTTSNTADVVYNFEYDELGRKTTVKVGNQALSTNVYKLTAYNGVSITYDAIGNPLSDGTWTYEWQAGRQLKSMTNAATGVTMEFTYNHAGIRTKKVKKVNGVLAETTEYMLNGKIVVGLTHTDHASDEVDTMWFFYDAQGKVAQVNFNGSVYSYVRNLQGDIVGMLDNSGSLVVEYKYNAWGRQTMMDGVMANTLGEKNPFKYRGYMWDEDEESYYLWDRNYLCDLFRFLNGDYNNVTGYKPQSRAFAYAANNPIRYVDLNGREEVDIVIECYHVIHGANEEEHGHGKILLKTNARCKLFGLNCDEYILVSYERKSKLDVYLGKDAIAAYHENKDVIYYNIGCMSYNDFKYEFTS